MTCGRGTRRTLHPILVIEAHILKIGIRRKNIEVEAKETTPFKVPT